MLVEYELRDRFSAPATVATSSASRFGLAATAGTAGAANLSRGLVGVGASSGVAAGGLRTATAAAAGFMLSIAPLVIIGVVVAGVVALTTAVIGLGMAMTKASLSAFIPFERTMTRIITLVGETREVMQRVSADLLQMGPRLGRSVQELAESYFFVASAGFKAAEAMALTEMAGKGAAIGLGSAASVAETLTKILAAYARSALTAAEATDTLLITARLAAVAPETLGQGFSRIVGLAAAMDIKIGDLGVALALLTRIMGSTEESSTGLRSILSQMLKPAEGADKALAHYGLTMQMVRDAAKKDLIGTLQELNEIIGKNETVMAEIFPDVRGLTALLSLLAQEPQTVSDAMGQMANKMGEADKAMNVVRETLGFRWEQVRATFEAGLIELGEAIGEKLLPKLKEWGAWLIEFVQSGAFESTITRWANAIDTLVTALEAFLLVARILGQLEMAKARMFFPSGVFPVGRAPMSPRGQGEFRQLEAGLGAGAPGLAGAAADAGGGAAGGGGPRLLTPGPIQQIAKATAETARNTRSLVQMRRFALGGGDIGRLGVTPVELAQIRRAPTVVVQGGDEFSLLLGEMIQAAIMQMQRQGA